MSKILITGNKGFVGSHLTKMLLEKGHEVFGIGRHHAVGEMGFEHRMGAGKYDYARCDVSDFRQIERVFEKMGPFDYVYHLAAEFGRWNGEDFYEQLWSSNVIGTKNMIRLSEKYGYKMIHFSSSEVYGDYPGVMKEEIMDQMEIKQLNDYAMTKWVNEMQIRNSRAMRGTQTVIVRLFNSYGPGEIYQPYRSVNCKFCYHLLSNLPVTVYRGHCRTSIYITDMCRTLSHIIENFKSGEVYNIGAYREHSIEDLVNYVQQYTGADKSLITYTESEILTTQYKKLDVTKAERDLGHTIEVDLEEGIKRTIDWMREFYQRKE